MIRYTCDSCGITGLKKTVFCVGVQLYDVTHRFTDLDNELTYLAHVCNTCRPKVLEKLDSVFENIKLEQEDK